MWTMSCHNENKFSNLNLCTFVIKSICKNTSIVSFESNLTLITFVSFKGLSCSCFVYYPNLIQSYCCFILNSFFFTLSVRVSFKRFVFVVFCKTLLPSFLKHLILNSRIWQYTTQLTNKKETKHHSALSFLKTILKGKLVLKILINFKSLLNIVSIFNVIS